MLFVVGSRGRWGRTSVGATPGALCGGVGKGVTGPAHRIGIENFSLRRGRWGGVWTGEVYKRRVIYKYENSHRAVTVDKWG